MGVFGVSVPSVFRTLIGRSVFVLGASFFLTWGFPVQGQATDLTGNGLASVSSGDSYDYVYGFRSQGGNAVADDSTVRVTGGSIAMDLYGGSALSRVGSAEASNNSVLVSGGLTGFNDNIYGGYARSYVSDVSASHNTVSMAGSLRLGPWVQVFGGYAKMSGGSGMVEAVDNSVSIGDGASLDFVVGGEAYGESSAVASSLSSGNFVNVDGGAVRLIYGGYAIAKGDASAVNNTVSISGGSFGDVVGGEVHSYEGKGTADGNTVTISGGTGTANVVGGSVQSDSGTASASDNTVSISHASIAGSVSGGFAPQSEVEAQVNRNTVIIGEGATVSGNAAGGAVTGAELGGTADANTVTVRGGSVDGNVYGGFVETGASASRNTVYVENGTVGGNISGGFAQDNGETVSVDGNTVVVSGNTLVSGSLSGGSVTGTPTGSSADSNTVAVVDGARVAGDVYGGMVSSTESSASYNTVLIRNAAVDGSIYGGEGAADSAAAHNNVIIGAGANLSSGTSLFGGVVDGAPVSAAGTGNTLFVDSWQGSAARVAGFENLHFVLPAPGAPVDVPMLTVTDARSGDFAGSVVTAQLPGVITGGRAYLGETFTLLSDASGAVAQADAGRLVSLQNGYASYFDGVLNNTGTAVQLQLTEVRMNPRIAALTEARAASTGLLNQGADLAADTGLRHARAAAGSAGHEWMPFAAGYGGASRYHTGSRADTEGFSGMTGVTGGFESDMGEAVVGAFFEFGRAHLDTFNGFVSGDVNGRGTSRYAGGGLLARFDIGTGPLTGGYAEGVWRMGNMDTDWYSDDLRDNLNRPADYDLSNHYYGGHVGLGYLLPIGGLFDVDVYGKFFWTHQSGDKADMNGEIVNFNSVDSRRLRLGMRLDVTLFDTLTPYVGAAWEHEYSGTARAVAQDFSIPDASLKGDSGLFELGLSMEPASGPLVFDVAFQGSTGERDGLGGHLSVLYRF